MTGWVLRALLLLLPLILYLLWRRHVRRKAAATEAGDQTTLDALQSQFLWIVLALVVGFGVVAGILAFSSGEDPSKTYVPPHMKDGKLVPGEFR
ncbi:MAG: hypothetical protein D6763_03630 [Alphaproteobacteria bacterium]|nr:MAG: hypothetical protein D6763_03630 [Alphaproteobacteria bacterium]